MTEYDRLKRQSHVVVATCAFDACLFPDREIRASIDPVRFWGVDRPVHQWCFDAFTVARQRSGGTVHDDPELGREATAIVEQAKRTEKRIRRADLDAGDPNDSVPHRNDGDR